MKNILLLLFPFLWITPIPKTEKIIISCSPSDLKAAFAVDVFSVRDGNWYDGSTWSGGKVPAESDNITASHHLWSISNVIIRNQLTAQKGSLEFRNIDESKAVEIGSDNFDNPRTSSIGLWVLSAGKLNLEGDYKTPFGYAQGNVLKGATSIIVPGITGWKVGDEVVVNPTTATPRKLPLDSDQSDFNRDNAGNPIDPFAPNFERRFIAAISGNNISFSGGLQFDHSAVDVHGKLFTALIVNLTRSFEIRGTKTGYSHVYIHSTSAQKLKNIGIRYPGPRKNGQIIGGLYGLHQHHSGYGSAGSVIDGCVIYDGHSRGYVTHESNAVTLSNNVAFNLYGASFWWDFQDQSHLIKYLHNYSGLQTNDGVNSTESSFLFGQGDGNVANDNIVIRGDKPKGGAYEWEADNESAWEFKRNVASNGRIGIPYWQNTPHLDHAVDDFTGFNLVRYAVAHGAYGNSVRYNRCTFVNTNVQIQASSSYTLGMALDNSWMKDVKLQIHGSANPSDYPNMFRSDTMTGNSVVEMYTPTENGSIHMRLKKAAFINCIGMKYTFDTQPAWDSEFYVQEGGSARIIKRSGTTASPVLYPDNYGNGDGLKGSFYNGSNFNSIAWEEISPIPGIAQASIDYKTTPDGLDHRITNKNEYSVRWEGFIEPHFSGQQSFRIAGAQGYRLWVDNKLILDDWVDHGETTYNRTSSSISLNRGVKYQIRIETFNSAPPYEIYFKWLQNGQYVFVPQSQLYTKSDIVIPVPVNQNPSVTLGNDIVLNWPDSTTKIDGTASDPDGTIDGYVWSKISGGSAVIENNLSDGADAKIVGLTAGAYVFKLTVKDNKGAAASDEIRITLNAKPKDTVVVPPTNVLQANAGNDTTITGSSIILDGSRSTGAIVSYKWDFYGGPKQPNFNANTSKSTNVNGLIKGTYRFNLRVTDNTGRTSNDEVLVTVGTVAPVVFKNKALTDTCTSGKIILIPAGKYTGVSQATVDALALQEMNVELAKCPVPIAEFMDGVKKVLVFKEGETYKFIVKP